jgi:hypothetical protein
VRAFCIAVKFNRLDAIIRSRRFLFGGNMTATNVLLPLAIALAGIMASAQQPSTFHAERVVRTGRFSLDTGPEKAFPLFTPLGELHWAAGWSPEVLYPADGHPVEGLLFRTPDHGGTYWWMTRYDPAKHVVEYHAVAPAGFGRNIRVECKPVGNRTEVVVTDTYIAVSEHGNEFIRSLTEESYAHKMKGWEEPISRYLRQTQ